MMIDQRERFERAFELFEMPEPALDRLLRRHDRRQRNRRIAAGAVAVVLTGLVIGGWLAALSLDRTTPADEQLPSADPAGRIAFMNGGEVYLMDPDGTDVVRLRDELGLPEELSVRAPARSPSGDAIAFLGRIDPPERSQDPADGTLNLYVASADGETLRRITRFASPAIVTNPAWSPDGETIAFTTYEPLDRTRIHVIDADGSDPRMLTDEIRSTFGVQPVWSPDGTSVALYGDHGPELDMTRELGIYAVDIRDGSVELFAPSPLGPVRWVNAVLSPDWTRIAFSDSLDDINVLTVGESEPKRITTDPAPDHSPVWSPDGTHIAFARTQDADGNSGVYVVSPDGWDETRLIGDPSDAWPVSWWAGAVRAEDQTQVPVPRSIGSVALSHGMCTLDEADVSAEAGLVELSARNDGDLLAAFDLVRFEPEELSYEEFAAYIEKQRRRVEAGKPFTQSRNEVFGGIGLPGFAGTLLHEEVPPHTSDRITGTIPPGTYAVVCFSAYEAGGRLRPIAITGPIEVA